MSEQNVPSVSDERIAELERRYERDMADLQGASSPHSDLDKAVALARLILNPPDLTWRDHLTRNYVVPSPEKELLAHALVRLVEQYESRERELFGTGKALANADRVAEELTKRIAELQEQLEAERRRADRNQEHLNVERDANAKTVKYLNEQLETAQADAERELEVAQAHEVELKRLREQFDTFRQAVEDFLESQGYNPLDIGQLLTSFAVSSPASASGVSGVPDTSGGAVGSVTPAEPEAEESSPAKERGTPGEWITGEDAKALAREKLASTQDTRGE